MPRSEWKSSPGLGLRSAIARLSARRVTVEVLLRAIVHPIMRRELALQRAHLRARRDLRLQLLHLPLERQLLRISLRRLQNFRKAQTGGLGRRLELSFAVVLLPLREHERVDVQSMGYVLRLNLWM